VHLGYAGNGDVFQDAWRGIAESCGCDTFIMADDVAPFVDGGISLTWDCLAPGTYYYPVVADPSAEGGYVVSAFRAACNAPCTVSTEDCCAAHDGPGCNDSTCCELICATDDFCCNVSWDVLCAETASVACLACPGNACENSTIGCLIEHDEPGCWDSLLCQSICACQPQCCIDQWDAACIRGGLGDGCDANDICTIDYEQLILPFDFNDDGDRDLQDYRAFANCLDGPCDDCIPEVDLSDCCLLGDWFGEGDIELHDFSRFQNLFRP
jgi:hypothetical protein